ncbi:hypothetical protein HMPREF9946_04449 [Acetobacteraceae bacterium AT-5844]|nr:hypothetical protein HMPREF9946_04449 [Acetobacteraceae bacterium AT-5844]
MQFFTKDHLGHKRPLNMFLADDELKIVFLHDCAGIIEKLLRLGGAAEHYVFVLTWSWWVDENKCLQLAKMISGLKQNYPEMAQSIQNNIIICMNSSSEYARYRAIDPVSRCIMANNACFLSPRLFRPLVNTLDSSAPAVLNAKSWLFKRHYLTQKLTNKIFISYREEADKSNPQYSNIREYHPAELYFDISPEKVVEINSRASFGLALSEVEGACYASAEYLLCGLPVVSTSSLGGREEFYTPRNSMIAHPSEIGLLDADDLMRKRLSSGYFDRAAIRQGMLAKIKEYRSCLSQEIAYATGISSTMIYDILQRACDLDNKLYHKRNFWIKELYRAED